MSEDTGTRRERRSVYTLLVLIVMVIAAGRIATVLSREGDTAFLSANDRSRWCTIAALVEDGTFAIDRLIQIRDERGRRPWYTIDLVRHRGEDGQLHYYSSKPPLFPTLVAGVYAVVHAATGMTLTDQPIYVTRIVLGLVNLPLFGLWLLAMVRAIELIGGGRAGGSDWTRRLLVATACFGTLLLPFVWSLSNHLPAAAASAVALWIYLEAAQRIRHGGGGSQEGRDAAAFVPAWWWVIMGIAAAFAAANELPALSMFVFWGILAVWLERRAAVPFAAGALLVAFGFFGTNWWAHQSLRPPYAHRGVGPTVAEVDLPRSEWGAEPSAAATERVQAELQRRGVIREDAEVQIAPSSVPSRWMLVTDDNRLFALLPREGDANADSLRIAQWDDWYEYPGSYWRGGTRRGVDRGEPSRGAYLLHMTLGHHGLFSLTPLWLLVPWGWVLGIRSNPAGIQRMFVATATATIVCAAFYVARPEIDRNYGGVSIGFRWLLWLIPFWILAAVPAVRVLARSRSGRGLVWLLLGCSLFSVATSLQTPWQHPWLYRFWLFLGWIAE